MLESAESARALFKRANTLAGQGRYADSIPDFDSALALAPSMMEAHHNRAMALAALGRVDEALAGLDEAIRLGPAHEKLYTNRGFLLLQLGRAGGARDSFDLAVAHKPDHALALWNRGLANLSLGAFDQGWRDYEHRWAVEHFRKIAGQAAGLSGRFDLHLPAAQALAGQRVMLLAEQGVGDVVMFASMIPDVIAIASRVTLACEPRLCRLMAQSFPGLDVVAMAPSHFFMPPFDRLLPVGSLGRLFRNRWEEFPGTPYLVPSREASDRWAEILGPKTAQRRIGLSWRGGMAGTRRGDRSMALASLKPLLDLADCEFVSLQYGDVSAEVAAVNAGLARPIRSFEAAAMDDFDDLAGLILELDAVVSVQTALVHLCGSLGVSCIAMLPSVPEWRYAAHPTRMPWYDSVRLVRQTNGGWGPVIDAVRASLSTA